MSSERTPQGRFAEGNPGGPGRPRRTVEREYLATLSEAVTLETWRAIIDAAIDQARNGDDKARAWLSKYCLGERPISLLDMAAQDAANLTTEQIVARRAKRIQLNSKQEDSTMKLAESLHCLTD